MKIKVNCVNCGRFCMKSPCYVKRSRNLFCSNKCKFKWSRMKNATRWSGGRRVDPQGYILLRVVDRDKPIYEHRYLMEKHLGRLLLKEEFVHHVNFIKTDNRLENLQVCSNSEHSKIHGAKRMNGLWSLKYGDKCAECGTSEKKHFSKGKCYNCYMRGYRAKQIAA